MKATCEFLFLMQRLNYQEKMGPVTGMKLKAMSVKNGSDLIEGGVIRLDQLGKRQIYEFERRAMKIYNQAVKNGTQPIL